MHDPDQGSSASDWREINYSTQTSRCRRRDTHAIPIRFAAGLRHDDARSRQGIANGCQEVPPNLPDTLSADGRFQISRAVQFQTTSPPAFRDGFHLPRSFQARSESGFHRCRCKSWPNRPSNQDVQRNQIVFYCFEPSLRTFRKLEDYVHDEAGVFLHNIGLSDRVGQVTLYTPSYGGYIFDGLASILREEAVNWLNPDRLYLFDPGKLQILEETIEALHTGCPSAPASVRQDRCSGYGIASAQGWQDDNFDV